MPCINEETTSLGVTIAMDSYPGERSHVLVEAYEWVVVRIVWRGVQRTWYVSFFLQEASSRFVRLLPLIENVLILDLVAFFHVIMCSPDPRTWVTAIKDGHFTT